MQQEKLCFVIMPFSASRTCTEAEWTSIFETKIQPAVENSGLGYVCRRSEATRGNILRGILEDLNSAHVVIADLTDSNPNVFYELGVRHALRDRTILLSQNSSDIPFDLRQYAYHIYDWRTEQGTDALNTRIKELLQDVENRPIRSDNPVTDFLRASGEAQSSSTQNSQTASARPELSLFGATESGVEGRQIAEHLSTTPNSGTQRALERNTFRDIPATMERLMGQLATKNIPESVQEKDGLSVINDLVDDPSNSTVDVDRFTWTASEEDSEVLVQAACRIAGHMITASFANSNQPSLIVKGLPAFLAWRLLMVAGACAVANRSYQALVSVVAEPIEATDARGRVSTTPFPAKRELFWPDTAYQRADWAVRYLFDLDQSLPYVLEYFADKTAYLKALAEFQYIVALADAKSTRKGGPLYPGCFINPQARSAVTSLSTRLVGSPPYLQAVANSLGETPAAFKAAWTDRARAVNSTELGRSFRGAFKAKLPERLGDPPDFDW